METNETKLKEIAKKYDLKLILLFGSRARGNTHEESDTDIAFIGSKALDFNEKGVLTVDLIPVLKEKETKIDVVDLRTAYPLLLQGIMRDAKVIYGDMMIFYELRAAAFKKYIETKPLYKIMEEQLKSRILDFKQKHDA